MCVWYACSVCVCVCLHVYSHMCVGVQRHMCTFMCVLHACRGLKLIIGIIFHSSYSLRWDLSVKSKVHWHGLSPWPVYSGYPLLLFQGCNYRQATVTTQRFLWVLGIKLSSSHLRGQALKPQTYLSNP